MRKADNQTGSRSQWISLGLSYIGEIMLYDRWLASGKEEDMTRFKVARNEARKSIREAKNSWFRAKAQEAEGESFGGKKVWKCIRDMQFGRRGRVPTRVVAICDESGELQHTN